MTKIKSFMKYFKKGSWNISENVSEIFSIFQSEIFHSAFPAPRQQQVIRDVAQNALRLAAVVAREHFRPPPAAPKKSPNVRDMSPNLATSQS